jgi:hypothetical protein
MRAPLAARTSAKRKGSMLFPDLPRKVKFIV